MERWILVKNSGKLKYYKGEVPTHAQLWKDDEDVLIAKGYIIDGQAVVDSVVDENSKTISKVVLDCDRTS